MNSYIIIRVYPPCAPILCTPHFAPHTLCPLPTLRLPSILCASTLCTSYFALPYLTPPNFVPQHLAPPHFTPSHFAPSHFAPQHFAIPIRLVIKLRKNIALIHWPILHLSLVYALIKQNQCYGIIEFISNKLIAIFFLNWSPTNFLILGRYRLLQALYIMR